MDARWMWEERGPHSNNVLNSIIKCSIARQDPRHHKIANTLLDPQEIHSQVYCACICSRALPHVHLESIPCDNCSTVFHCSSLPCIILNTTEEQKQNNNNKTTTTTTTTTTKQERPRNKANFGSCTPNMYSNVHGCTYNTPVTITTSIRSD